jgi:hypothetical protein
MLPRAELTVDDWDVLAESFSLVLAVCRKGGLTLFDVFRFTFVLISCRTFFVVDNRAFLSVAWQTLVLIGCPTSFLISRYAIVGITCFANVFTYGIADFAKRWRAPVSEKKLIFFYFIYYTLFPSLLSGISHESLCANFSIFKKFIKTHYRISIGKSAQADIKLK